MSRTEKELEGLLTGETKAIIKKLLAERKPAGEMSIGDIEQVVLRAGQRFEVLLTEALIEAEETEMKGERPSCPECDGKMRHRRC